MAAEKWIGISEALDYEVSSLGRVRRRRPDWQGKYQGRLLRPASSRGYLRVTLCLGDGSKVTRQVHRLVCEAFHGPCPPDKDQCAHRDGSRDNNVPDNLYWATGIENAADRERHGRTPRGPTSGAVLHPERRCKGDDHWTRKTPDRIPRGGDHYRRAGGYVAPNGTAIATCKLTEADVVAIRSTPELRGTGKMLAERYGVSMGLISAIRKGRVWRHLGQDQPPAVRAVSNTLA
jgi:hypothetical protein